MRLWPSGLVGRVAAILVAGIVVVQVAGAVLYFHDQGTITARAFAGITAQRIAAIVEALDRAAPEDRPLLLKGFNGPTLWVIPSRTRPPAGEPWHQEGEVRQMLMRHLHGHFPPDAIRVSRVGRWGGYPPDQASRLGGDFADILPSRQKIAIVIDRPPDGWLTFVVTSHRPSLAWLGRLGFWFLLFGLVALGAAVYAARRMTKPLRQFAEAAERLGTDVHTPPLPETGSGELLNATVAFNRMQERLRRFIDDRTLMLAAISHDLRTALTRLRLRVEFIGDAEQQRKAEADLDEMQAMIEETLAFGRDDAAQEPRQKVDVTSLVQSVCDDLSDAGKQAKFEPGGRLSCQCRPLALRRALVNLIANAAAYGGAAEVRLERRAGELVVIVADRGPGIPPHLREKAFTPFFRLEPSRNRATGGTGLGLAVARSIARAHGGDVTLHDRDGGGLEARLTLPCAGD